MPAVQVFDCTDCCLDAQLASWICFRSFYQGARPAHKEAVSAAGKPRTCELVAAVSANGLPVSDFQEKDDHCQEQSDRIGEDQRQIAKQQPVHQPQQDANGKGDVHQQRNIFGPFSLDRMDDLGQECQSRAGCRQQADDDRGLEIRNRSPGNEERWRNLKPVSSPADERDSHTHKKCGLPDPLNP
jgi:hypothetical protein